MNLSNTCRLCHGADPDRLISINKNKNLAIDIEKELHVKIENDDKLPQQICDDCLIRVKEWVFYKSSVERHQKYLKRCQREQDSSSIEHSSEAITESVSVSSSVSKKSKNGVMVDNTQISKRNDKTPTKSSIRKNQRDIRNFLSPNKPFVSELGNGRVRIIEDDEATQIQKPNQEERSNSIISAIVEENNSEDIFSLSRIKIEATRQIRENQGNLKKLMWRKNGTFCVYCEVFISKEYLFKGHVRLKKHRLNRQRFQMRGLIKNSSRSYYGCKLCALKFTNKQFLYRHAKSVHGLKRSEVVVSPKRNKNPARNPDNVASDPEAALPDTKSENNDTVQIKVEDVKEDAVQNFFCASCKIKFPDNQAGKIHSALHSSSNLVKCFKCSEKFLGETRYLNHLKKCFALDKDSVFCNTCFDVFANPKLRIAHQKKFHCKLSHKCNLCDEHFKTISELKLHKRGIHFTTLGSEKNHVGSQELSAVAVCDPKNDENQRALCIFCTCLLNSVDDYESHFKFYCEGPFICPDCKQEFVDFELFCDHRINIHRLIGINRSFLQIIREDTPPTDLVERYDESSITSKPPNSNDSSRSFICPKKCGTRNILDLKAHTDVCVGSAFSCSVCFSFYTTENRLIRHVCKPKNSIVKSKQTQSSDIVNNLSTPSASSAEIIIENVRTSANTDESSSSVAISESISNWKSIRRQSSDNNELPISIEENNKPEIINENEFKKKRTVDWPMANRTSVPPSSSYSNDRYKSVPPYSGYHRTTYTWHSNSQQFQNPCRQTNDNIENDDRRRPPPPPPSRTLVKNRTSALFEQQQPQPRSEFKFQSYTQPKSNILGRFYPASEYNSINFKYYFNINYDLTGQRQIKCKECGFYTKARETALQHLVRERGIWYCRYSEKMITYNTTNTASHFV